MQQLGSHVGAHNSTAVRLTRHQSAANVGWDATMQHGIGKSDDNSCSSDHQQQMKRARLELGKRMQPLPGYTHSHAAGAACDDASLAQVVGGSVQHDDGSLESLATASAMLEHQGSCGMPQGSLQQHDLATLSQHMAQAVQSSTQYAADAAVSEQHTGSRDACVPNTAEYDAALQSAEHTQQCADAEISAATPSHTDGTTDRGRHAGVKSSQHLAEYERVIQARTSARDEESLRGAASGASVSKPATSITSCMPKLNKQVSARSNSELTAKEVAKLWGVNLRKYVGRGK